jgi:hypothetical protein
VKHQPAWAGPDYVHFTEAGAYEIDTDSLQFVFLIHYDFYALRKSQKFRTIDKFMQLGINEEICIACFLFFYSLHKPSFSIAFHPS